MVLWKNMTFTQLLWDEKKVIILMKEPTSQPIVPSVVCLLLKDNVEIKNRF